MMRLLSATDRSRLSNSSSILKLSNCTMTDKSSVILVTLKFKCSNSSFEYLFGEIFLAQERVFGNMIFTVFKVFLPGRKHSPKRLNSVITLCKSIHMCHILYSTLFPILFRPHKYQSFFVILLTTQRTPLFSNIFFIRCQTCSMKNV